MGLVLLCTKLTNGFRVWRVSQTVSISVNGDIDSVALPTLWSCQEHCLGSGWENPLHTWRGFLVALGASSEVLCVL